VVIVEAAKAEGQTAIEPGERCESD